MVERKLGAEHILGAVLELVGFVNDDDIAVSDHLAAGHVLDLDRCKEHIVVDHLKVEVFLGTVACKVVMVPTFLYVLALLARAFHADLSFESAADVIAVKVKGSARKIFDFKHIEDSLMLLGVLLEVRYEVFIALLTEVMLLTFTNNHAEWLLDEVIFHEHCRERRDFLFYKCSLKLDARGCDGDGLAEVEVCVCVLCNKSCYEIRKCLSGADLCFADADELSAQSFIDVL